LKICLIGHFGDTLDEGSRIVGKSLAGELRKMSHSVQMSDMSSLKTVRDIFLSKPDVLHFVLTPTWQGVIVSKIMSLFSPGSKLIISAMHPAVPQWRFLRLFRPDVVLVQSDDSKRLFESIGFRTVSLSNGVDISRFCPADAPVKKELRAKYGIADDQFVILHLASLTEQRNLGVFRGLQKKDGNLCLILGRENENYNEEVVRGLKESGCQVWIKHFDNVEDIYRLSDCYLFPTVDKKACIETPLSVLEAMACNLPVISTRFGSLPQIFGTGAGMYYIDADEDCYKIIENLKTNGTGIGTRDMVRDYSWGRIGNALVKIYESL